MGGGGGGGGAEDGEVGRGEGGVSEHNSLRQYLRHLAYLKTVRMPAEFCGEPWP